MDSQWVPTVEEVVARRVSALRRSREWSQTDLGERMAAHGCPMTQPVVWKLEQARRPLRVNEAAALAQVFDVPLAALLDVEGAHQDLQREEELIERVRRTAAGLATARLERERLEARVAAETERLAAARAAEEFAEEMAAGAEGQLHDHLNLVEPPELGGLLTMPATMADAEVQS